MGYCLKRKISIGALSSIAFRIRKITAGKENMLLMLSCVGIVSKLEILLASVEPLGLPAEQVVEAHLLNV